MNRFSNAIEKFGYKRNHCEFNQNIIYSLFVLQITLPIYRNNLNQLQIKLFNSNLILLLFYSPIVIKKTCLFFVSDNLHIYYLFSILIRNYQENSEK